jgi:glycogen debranching enzyme
VLVTPIASGEEIARAVTKGKKIEELLRKEWLLTNERGSFASSTIAACNTSGYHGLLIGSPDPLVRRTLALATCLEAVLWNGRSLELATFEFADRFAPQGYAHLQEFRRDTGVHFLFRTEPVDLCKSVYLARDSDTVLVEYTFDEVRAPVDFVLRPFVGMRDFHTLQRSHAPLACRIAENRVCIQNGAATESELWLSCGSLGFESDPQWWFNFVYRANRARGLSCAEDLWAPGFFKAHLEQPGSLVFQGHLCGHGVPEPPAQVEAEAIKEDLLRRQEQLLERAGAAEKTHRVLCLAADQFVVKRRSAAGERTTIVAGFPWFADWGRDTFIALPGLLLATGRHEEAGSVLNTFAAAVDQGMVPNRFDDRTGAAQFNSVDASLWFIHAAFEYLDAVERAGESGMGLGSPTHNSALGGPFQPMRHRQDADATKSHGHEPAPAPAGDARDTFARQLLPVIRSIIAAYHTGTRFGIHADSDGLIVAGDGNTQLTWMDAQCDGVVFTPRCGKAVEVNALWHNALRRTQKFCESRVEGMGLPNASFRAGDPVPPSERGQDARDTLATDARRYAALAEQVGQSFCKLFWNVQRDYLNDAIRPDGTVDDSLRPNQIFAVSLPFGPPLARVQQWAVVGAVEQKLLTSYGPRTLSSLSPAYRGRYEGTLRQRDEAYHQGTVWPFLMGPFLEAYLKVRNYSEESKSDAAELLRPLLRHLTEDACLGSISEVFDGDPIHRPGGCWAQAWSVAELLRIYRLVAPE